MKEGMNMTLDLNLKAFKQYFVLITKKFFESFSKFFCIDFQVNSLVTVTLYQVTDHKGLQWFV